MSKILSKIIFVCLLFPTDDLLAQGETIKLQNPGFEDRPKRGGDPTFDGIKGWFDCGKINFAAETPPDIHPNGFWQNNLPAAEGKTYLGLVTRDNNTYESVSQRISDPLLANKCYQISVILSRAPVYISNTRTTGKEDNYVNPIVLRIWGGSIICNEKELLAESAPVENVSWQINKFEFRPKTEIRSITISAFFKTPTLYPYNGNILVDGVSDITRIACPDEAIVAEVEKSNLPLHKRKKQVPKPVSTEPNKDISSAEIKQKEAPQVIVPFKPKILQDLERSRIRKGQTIEIKNLLFDADSAKINFNSYSVLNELYGFLIANPDMVIEIGGHTNDIPEDAYCDWLSTARAKAVTEYLVNKGVQQEKIQFKGYGKRQPIANNKTKFGRDKNQRVEIKILSFNT